MLIFICIPLFGHFGGKASLAPRLDRLGRLSVFFVVFAPFFLPVAMFFLAFPRFFILLALLATHLAVVFPAVVIGFPLILSNFFPFMGGLLGKHR